MSQVSYIFDEDVPHSLIGAVYALEPLIAIQVVGLPMGPAKGTKDPELLTLAAESDAVIVSRDRKTMIGFARQRIAAGLPMSGLLVIRSERESPGEIAENLSLIWSITSLEEWHHKIDYLPL